MIGRLKCNRPSASVEGSVRDKMSSEKNLNVVDMV